MAAKRPSTPRSRRSVESVVRARMYVFELDGHFAQKRKPSSLVRTPWLVISGFYQHLRAHYRRTKCFKVSHGLVTGIRHVAQAAEIECNNLEVWAALFAPIDRQLNEARKYVRSWLGGFLLINTADQAESCDVIVEAHPDGSVIITFFSVAGSRVARHNAIASLEGPLKYKSVVVHPSIAKRVQRVSRDAYPGTHYRTGLAFTQSLNNTDSGIRHQRRIRVTSQQVFFRSPIQEHALAEVIASIAVTKWFRGDAIIKRQGMWRVNAIRIGKSARQRRLAKKLVPTLTDRQLLSPKVHAYINFDASRSVVNLVRLPCDDPEHRGEQVLWGEWYGIPLATTLARVDARRHRLLRDALSPFPATRAAAEEGWFEMRQQISSLRSMAGGGKTMDDFASAAFEPLERQMKRVEQQMKDLFASRRSSAETKQKDKQARREKARIVVEIYRVVGSGLITFAAVTTGVAAAVFPLDTLVVIGVALGLIALVAIFRRM